MLLLEAVGNSLCSVYRPDIPLRESIALRDVSTDVQIGLAVTKMAAVYTKKPSLIRAGFTTKGK